MPQKAKEAGRLLASAWLSDRRIDPLPSALAPVDLREAMAVQDAMAAAIGEPVVGWKVGGAPGPLVGRIFASRLMRSGDTIPASRHAGTGLECEIGFRLLKDFPPRAGAYTEDEIFANASLVMGIELTNSRFIGGKHSADHDWEVPAIVADNAAQGGYIAGPVCDDWRALDLLGIHVECRIDDGLPLPANPRESRTEPAAILAWLVNDLARRGIALAAGQYVTTGSATRPCALSPGNAVSAVFAEFGRIDFEVGAG